MPVRTHATFDADFPDDGEWDDDGIPLKPAGENVANAIRNGLTNRGIRCSEILQRSFYGWEFDYDVDGTSFICVVQGYEDDQWLLICEPRQNVWRKLFMRKDDDKLRQGSTTLHGALTSDSRFSNVRWYDREQFEKGGG